MSALQPAFLKVLTDDIASAGLDRETVLALIRYATALSNEFQGRMLIDGGPCIIQRAIREARAKIDGLPDGFSAHDLRHRYAILLIAAGENIKTVQTRMRHASARTTLDVYSHLFPDADDSTRSAVSAALTRRSAKQTG